MSARPAKPGAAGCGGSRRRACCCPSGSRRSHSGSRSAISTSERSGRRSGARACCRSSRSRCPRTSLNLWLRALRWRHLTDPVVSRAPQARLFRGQAIGFMANNVFPLRIGEVLRAWYVARETGAPGAALFGTVIVERVVDAVVVVALAAMVLGVGGAKAAGLETRTVLFPLLGIALAPLGFVLLLRFAPARVIAARLAGLEPGALARHAPSASAPASSTWRTGCAGCGAGRPSPGSRFYSLVLWLVVAVIPFVATLWSLHIDLGSTSRTLLAAYVAPDVGGGGGRHPFRPGVLWPLSRGLLGGSGSLRGAQGAGNRPRDPGPRGVLAHDHRSPASSCCAAAATPLPDLDDGRSRVKVPAGTADNRAGSRRFPGCAGARGKRPCAGRFREPADPRRRGRGQVVNERIGELLVKENLISAEQLRKARDEAKSSGGRLGAQITRLGFLQEAELSDFVAKQYGVPTIDLDEFDVDPAVIQLIPEEVARKHTVLPGEPRRLDADHGDGRPLEHLRHRRHQVPHRLQRRGRRRLRGLDQARDRQALRAGPEPRRHHGRLRRLGSRARPRTPTTSTSARSRRSPRTPRSSSS